MAPRTWTLAGGQRSGRGTDPTLDPRIFIVRNAIHGPLPDDDLTDLYTAEVIIHALIDTGYLDA